MRGHQTHRGRLSRARRALAVGSSGLVASAFFVVGPQSRAAADSLASPTLTTAATPATAAVGETVQDDATLSGGSAPSGTLTFTVTDASNTVVHTETVAVTGNGAYVTPTGHTAIATGTYQWSARETTPSPSTTVQYIFNAGLTGSSSEIDLKFV